VLEAFGLKWLTLIPGFVGAMISLKFIEGQSRSQRATTVVAGMLAAAYCTPLTIDLLLWADVFSAAPSPRTEGAIAFLGGLFGMALIGAVIKAIPDWIAAAKAKFLGGGGS
jgi:hypothetical protein